MQQGDFSELAKSYHHRVGYSHVVLKKIISLHDKKPGDLRVADVGAGTGKLTLDLVGLGLSPTAIEPNDSMRREGIRETHGNKVDWRKGSGEQTGLENGCMDWICVGSAFHWMDLQKALAEFHRVLGAGGLVTVLWNPRDLERSDLRRTIDEMIRSEIPHLKRVSSGGKTYGVDWSKRLVSTGQFEDPVVHEDFYEIEMSRDRYLGIWNSVNDIQAQCPQQTWQNILRRMMDILEPYPTLKVPYSTRAWTARKTESRT